MPVRSQHVLILNAVTIVLTMALMGYARSASRVHWHIYGVLEDTSPHAYSPALGHAGTLASLSTFIFFLLVVFLFWTITRTSRPLGFSTQYFFLAPFIHWAVSLSEKPAAPGPQVSGQPRYFGKAMATACGFLIVFAYLAHQVPQLVSLPPQKVEFDPSQITTRAELVKVGQGIFFGKGQCALCHSLEPTEAPRAPVLRGIGAKLTREFIYESVTQPQAYIYMDYSSSPPRPFPAKMPVINKPPVGLSDPELLAVIAFVQSLGGEVTVQPEEVKALIPATMEEGMPHGN
jgi:mono/diheme cytochrome c family protein